MKNFKRITLGMLQFTFGVVSFSWRFGLVAAFCITGALVDIVAGLLNSKADWAGYAWKNARNVVIGYADRILTACETSLMLVTSGIALIFNSKDLPASLVL